MATGLSNASGLSATSSSLILVGRGLVDGAGLSAGGGLGGGGGSLSFDFSTGVLPSNMTFARSSVAWGFNSAGVLTQYAINEPRFVYDPVTLQSLGILIESTRINSLRNNTMVGAAAGTPGTTPTNWTVGTTLNAVTRTVVGTGTEDGIDYIDIQYAGTPSAGTTIFITFEAAGIIAAANAQVWTASAYLRLVGGSLANVSSLILRVDELDGASTVLASSVTSSLVPTSAPLRTQRQTLTRTFNNAGTLFTWSRITFAYTLGNAIDITLRIGLPQLEVADATAGTVTSMVGVSSPIKTSTVAVNRANEVVRVTDARFMTDKVYIIAARAAGGVGTTGVVQPLFQVDDNTINNRKGVWRATTGQMQLSMTTASVLQAAITLSPAVADNADYMIGARFDTDNTAISLNGAAVTLDTSCSLPAGLTVSRLGTTTNVINSLYSTIKSIATRVTASDAELQALSVAPVATDTELWMTAVVANGGSVSAARKVIVDQFIAAEKAAGTWALTDDYWPLWGESAAQALTSLKQRRLATAVAAPAFVVDRGFTSNGTTSYVNTGFICNTHAVALTGINMRLGVYLQVNIANGTQIPVGVFQSSTLNCSLVPRNSSNLMQANLACASSNTPGDTVLDSRGYMVGTRTNGSTAANIIGYRNGAALVPAVPGAFGSGLPTQPIFICARCDNVGAATNFYPAQVNFACIGASLTPAQEAAQYANVQAWATAIGANV